VHLARIRIENIRGFGDGEQAVDLDLRRPDGSLAGWTVFAGRNGAGKTTLLQAIAVALLGADTPLTQDEGRESWVRQGAHPAKLEVGLRADPQDRCVYIDWTQYDPEAVWAPRWQEWEDEYIRELTRIQQPAELMGVTLEWFRGRSSGGAEGSWSFRTQADFMREIIFQAGPWLPKPSGWFAAGYGPFRRLSGQSAEADALSQGSPRVAALAGLFREDLALGDSVRWLQDLRFRWLDKQEAETRELVEFTVALLNDGLLPDGVKLLRVDSDGLWFELRGRELRLERISDGYRVTAALVLDLLAKMHRTFGKNLQIDAHTRRVLNSGVVLIDEVEEHLHVSWQKRIGFWLKAHFPNIQFLVTTHSPFICQAADPQGLIRLNLPGEAPAAQHVEPETFRRIVEGGADDALVSELFGLEHTHSDASEKRRERLADLEAKELDDTLTDAERQELEHLRAEMPSTPSAAVEQALRLLAKG
jgi:hypothetical protein